MGASWVCSRGGEESFAGVVVFDGVVYIRSEGRRRRMTGKSLGLQESQGGADLDKLVEGHLSTSCFWEAEKV